MIYEFPIEIVLVKSGDQDVFFLADINTALAKFGVQDRVSINGEIAKITLTAPHILTKQEEELMQQNFQKYFDENHKAFSFVVKEPRRKSSNSKLLAI